MRTFEQYIREAVDFRLGGSDRKGIQQYNYFPKHGQELIELIKNIIKERGNEGDFNDIDTSNITHMNGIFWHTQSFNGDISQWDISSVTDMSYMFFAARYFNRSLSNWDTSEVKDMTSMFENAKNFNQDISSWNVSNVVKNSHAFDNCPIKEEYKPKFKI